MGIQLTDPLKNNSGVEISNKANAINLTKDQINLFSQPIVIGRSATGRSNISHIQAEMENTTDEIEYSEKMFKPVSTLSVLKMQPKITTLFPIPKRAHNRLKMALLILAGSLTLIAFVSVLLGMMLKSI